MSLCCAYLVVDKFSLESQGLAGEAWEGWEVVGGVGAGSAGWVGGHGERI